MKLWLGAAAAVGVLAMAQAAAAQGVDYHKAQQAGRVWQQKIKPEDTRTPQQRAEEARPITRAEWQAGLVRHRERYDKLVDSVGTKNADRFLDFWIRRDRREGVATKLAAAPAAKPAPAPAAKAACSIDVWPPAERQRLEAEFAVRVRRDGQQSAGAWASEQGRQLRQRLEAQGVC